MDTTIADSSSRRPGAFRPGRASFPVRPMTFAFDGLEKKYLFRGEPVESVFWLVVQALFPDGEQFFIDAVRDVRERVDDAALQDDIRAFMGQEATHGRAHRKANKAIRDKFGIDVVTTERRTRAIMGLYNRIHSPMQRLAMTAAAEHFTSTVASFLLHHPEYLNAFADPTVRRLVMWHALEEREHRSVAFDLFVKAGGGYGLRVVALPWMLGTLLPFVAWEMVRVLRAQEDLPSRAELRAGFAAVFGRRGTIAKLVPGLKEYFRRDFHPTDDDETAREAAWRTELGLTS